MFWCGGGGAAAGARLLSLGGASPENGGGSESTNPADLAAGDDFVPADLTDLAQVEKAVAGIEGIVHLGGHAVEGSWETILNANIIGCYNLFEAARRASVKRVIFASSNHAIVVYPPTQRIGVEGRVNPDSRYSC